MIYKRQPVQHKLPSNWQSADAENHLNIVNFSGLQSYDNPLLAELQSTYNSKNVYVDENGSLTVRPRLLTEKNIDISFNKIFEVEDIIIGYTNDKLIAIDNNETYEYAIKSGSDVTMQIFNGRPYFLVQTLSEELTLLRYFSKTFEKVTGSILLAETDVTDKKYDKFNILNDYFVSRSYVIPSVFPDINDLTKHSKLFTSELYRVYYISNYDFFWPKIININGTVFVIAKDFDAQVSVFIIPKNLQSADVKVYTKPFANPEYLVAFEYNGRLRLAYPGGAYRENVSGNTECTIVLIDISINGTVTENKKTFYIDHSVSELDGYRMITNGYNCYLITGVDKLLLLSSIDDLHDGDIFKLGDPTSPGHASKMIPRLSYGQYPGIYQVTPYCFFARFDKDDTDFGTIVTFDMDDSQYAPPSYRFIGTTSASGIIVADAEEQKIYVYTDKKSEYTLSSVLSIDEITIANFFDNKLYLYSDNQKEGYLFSTDKTYRFIFDSIGWPILSDKYVFYFSPYNAPLGFSDYLDFSFVQYADYIDTTINRDTTDIPVLSDISDNIVTSFYLDGFYWFITEHHIFGTGADNTGKLTIEYWDPRKYFEINETITGAMRVSDTSFWIFHNSGAYLVYKNSDLYYPDENLAGIYLWQITNTAKSKGCDFKNAIITLPVTSYVSTVTIDDICSVQMRENVQTDDRILVPMTTRIQKFVSDLLITTESIVIANYKYLTLYCLNQVSSNNVPILVYDNNRDNWWYWEFPINKVTQALPSEDNIRLLCRTDTDTKILTFSEDELEYTTGLLKTAAYGDTVHNEPRVIDWFWTSAIQIFDTLNYRKQLLQTTFMLHDSSPKINGIIQDQNQNFSYAFDIYSKNHLASKDTSVERKITRAEHMTYKTLIGNFMYLQITLKNQKPESDEFFDNLAVMTKPKFTGISFKYRVLSGGIT